MGIAILIYNLMKVQNSSTVSLKNYWINMKYIIIIHIIARRRRVLLNVFLQTYQAVLYRMMTEKNTNKFLNHHKKIITSYNMRPHIGLNCRTPHYVHFLKDRRKINVIAKEILDIKLQKNNRKSKTHQTSKKKKKKEKKKREKK